MAFKTLNLAELQFEFNNNFTNFEINNEQSNVF